MNIFFPFSKPKNPFLEEIEPYFKGTFIFDNYLNWEKYNDIDVINIHWPEKIFEWNEPTLQELEMFFSVFMEWKKRFKVVYTRHNIYPHYKKTKNYIKLYDFIANNVDSVIHFGNYSIEDYKNRYSNFIGLHRFIEHPLYLKNKKNKSKEETRELLNIPLKSKVVLVVGYIRSNEERKLVLESFAKVDNSNKLLIITKDIKHKAPLFLYSYKIKKLYERFKNRNYTIQNGFRILDNSYINDKDLIDYLNAADVLFIPRTNLLNSGNYYLGITYNKIIVAPEVGNITEKIRNTNNFGFNPLKLETISNAIEKAISSNIEVDNFEKGMKTMSPELIAQQMLDYFNELKKV